MAKNRYVDTRFWHDSFIRDNLNPLDRYLFLYFLTNDKTNICGIYELPLSMISSETGLEMGMIKKMLKRMKGKVDYFNGWIVMHNFIKFQNVSNPKIVAGIKKEFENVPKNIKNIIGYRYLIDKLSITTEQQESKSNSNLIKLNGSQFSFNKNKPVDKKIKLFYFKDPMVFKNTEKKWYTIKNNEWFAWGGNKSDEKNIYYILN